MGEPTTSQRDNNEPAERFINQGARHQRCRPPAILFCVARDSYPFLRLLVVVAGRSARVLVRSHVAPPPPLHTLRRLLIGSWLVWLGLWDRVGLGAHRPTRAYGWQELWGSHGWLLVRCHPKSKEEDKDFQMRSRRTRRMVAKTRLLSAFAGGCRCVCI